MTREDAEKEFALAFTITRSTRVLTRDEEDAAERCIMYDTPRNELVAKGYKLPESRPPQTQEVTLHRVEQNPDLDMYTKAESVKPRPKGLEPKPLKTTSKHERSCADLRRLAATNLAILKRTVRVK